MSRHPPSSAVDSPWLAAFDGSFRSKQAASAAPEGLGSKPEREKRLAASVAELAQLQHLLYADGRYSLLLIFQAMDAAGKDSTIRAVFSGVDPAGCSVVSFKRPSDEELKHDFLWRSACRLPARGQIGVFNRSYYEEVLVTRVNPQLLAAQHLPESTPKKKFWEQRYESIRNHEQHLAHNDTVVLKFWLKVSKDEQRRRLLARLEEPEKNWKFEAGDLTARDHWDEYEQAYEDAINATARAWAPWYVIPADSKSSMRLLVADLIVRTLRSLDLRYPTSSAAEIAQFAQMRARLGDPGKA